MYPPASKEFSDWDVLLDFIEDRRVIPITGSDIVRLNVNGESTTFDHYVAAELAERIGLPAGVKEERLPLNDVVCRYLSSGRGARQDLYPKIRAILREAPFAPPQSLRQLAEISHFDLFITTTVDSLMEKALNEVLERNLHDPEAFKHVEVKDSTRELLRQCARTSRVPGDEADDGTVHANRLLLE